MSMDRLTEILRAVAEGRCSVDQARKLLATYDVLGFARVDLHRSRRTGFPEIIFAQGKTPNQIATIFHRLQATGEPVLATRVTREQAEAVRNVTPDVEYDDVARLLRWWPPECPQTMSPGFVAVVCAGTADLPVAEEAAGTAEFLGSPVERVYDVGVAGLHRLLDQLSVLRKANVIIVVAGMEGALPSVVGGLVAAPVVAVPTSVGYGAHLNGLAPLLTMLNSCSAGVAVVNIDNGFGAGYYAALIHRSQVELTEMRDNAHGKNPAL
ncbi:nickel pincer cofactor biosynthesis protein LarB [Polycladomyces subterraneus]|uniref:Nickel pincer cofactor biosynthesis protein LarB n=1 Tax=Polycladomyces subterraneus TaxID=1016997 RepID=A0ABT8IRK9_9BACL|nr:nickel pincer cofactor biosynthesis protein LarB [Polycladomyces subterraneus]MDN4595445.1 nickel pincer cofactor biosynthesis protein LarB [Polycladomyces subterraneus]